MGFVGKYSHIIVTFIARGNRTRALVTLKYDSRVTLRFFGSVQRKTNCAFYRNENSIKQAIKHALVNEYQCSEKEAMNLVIPVFLKCSSNADILKNALHLKKVGIEKNSVITNPWLLGYNTNHLSSAIKCVDVLHDDLKAALPLLSIPYKVLHYISKKASKGTEYFPDGGKIRWLTQLLECDDYLLCQKLVKKSYVLSMDPKHIISVIDTLKEGGVSPSSLVNDMHLFRQKLQSLTRRLEILKEFDFKGAKPWCFRCSDKVFLRMIERQVETRTILGDYKTKMEYLTARLECDDREMQEIILKIPQVKHISVSKVKKLLDFLYQEGYTPEDVCSTPRIFTRNIDTVKSRLEELRQLKCKNVHPLLLCRTRREYSQLIRKLKKV